MKLKIKTFNSLTTNELYEILKIRSLIFVVEQNCIYQDMDDIDYESTHVWLEQKEIKAYLRYFKKDKNTIQIGRVLTKEHGIGLGKKLMEESIKEIKKDKTIKTIYLEAQTYALNVYKKFGFKEYGKEFLEDNIPHIKMKLVV